MSQSVWNIFRDTRELIIPYYSQNIRLQIIHYTCCLYFSSVGKCLKKSIQEALTLRQGRFKKISKARRYSFSHIECTVNVLGEDRTKVTNASIDKQKKALK